MSKVTIFSTSENLDYVAVGETITLKKEPSQFDPAMIVAYYQGNVIGNVGATVNVTLPGTVTNKDIWDEVPDEFTGIVTKQGQLARATVKIALEVEIAGTSASSSGTAAKGNKLFNFVVNGSSSKYAGKNTIITEMNQGRKVFLQLKKVAANNSETVVCYRMNNGVEELCGKIDEAKLGLNGNSSIEDYALIKSILDVESLECVVTSNMPTSYTIQIAVADETIDKFKTSATKNAISGVKQQLIDDGIKTEEELDELEEAMLNYKFTALMIQEIFKSYKLYPSEVAWRIPKKPSVIFDDGFGAMQVAYAAFINNYHVLASGDKGTGKNKFIETWAWILQRPLYAASINRDTDKLDMLGSKTIETVVDETTGKTIDTVAFSPEVMLEAMECGGIMNIDEINFADAGITGLLHSILDDRREIEVPGYKKVSADDNFFVMATMNIDYQGTNELNEALADRFIDIQFPSNESIMAILTLNCPKNPQSELATADAIYKQMFMAIQNRDSSLDSNCLTVRGFIQALNMSPVLGLKKALEVCVAGKIKDEEYQNNVKTIIDMKCK